jgi:hypothetical protein
MKNTVCYALLCVSPRTGRSYPRYFKTINRTPPYSLDEIKNQIEPNAVSVMILNSRRKAIEKIRPLLAPDERQPELFPLEN